MYDDIMLTILLHCIFIYNVVASYKPHSDVTMWPLIKFEVAIDVPVLTELEPKLSELSQRARFIPLDGMEGYVGGIKYEEKFFKIADYISSWSTCWRLGSEVVLPSWKNFLTVLREISPELRKIADQIQCYFDQFSTKQPSATESNGVYE